MNDDFHFVKSTLHRLETLGEQYSISAEHGVASKNKFQEIFETICSARSIAVENSTVSRKWAQLCWDFPLVLRGASEIWLTFEQRELWWQDALKAEKHWGDSIAKGHCLGALANIYSDKGEHKKAKKLYEQRLELARDKKQMLALTKTLLNLGNTALRLNELQSARKRLHEARIEARRHQFHKEEARAVGNLAVVTSRLGKTKLAITMLKTRIRILQQSKDLLQLASTYSNLGGYYTDLDLLDEANRNLKIALVIDKQIENRKGEGLVLAKMALLKEKTGAYAEAIEIMQKAALILDDCSSSDYANDCCEEIERLVARRNAEDSI